MLSHAGVREGMKHPPTKGTYTAIRTGVWRQEEDTMGNGWDRMGWDGKRNYVCDRLSRDSFLLGLGSWVLGSWGLFLFLPFAITLVWGVRP